MGFLLIGFWFFLPSKRCNSLVAQQMLFTLHLLQQPVCVQGPQADSQRLCVHRGTFCIYSGNLGRVYLCQHHEQLPLVCPAACPGMGGHCGPMDTPSSSFRYRTAGNTVGLPPPHSTGTAWKHCPLKAGQTLHFATWDQKAHYQHVDVRGGLITQKMQ